MILHERDDVAFILIKDDQEVGYILWDTLYPEGLINRLNDEEYYLLMDNQSQDIVHLKYITVKNDYRGAGLFLEAMGLFESMMRSRGFSKITLVPITVDLVKTYAKLEYIETGPLPSVDSLLMSKEL